MSANTDAARNFRLKRGGIPGADAPTIIDVDDVSNIYNVSSEKLAREIKGHHNEKEVHYMESFDKIKDFVMENAGKGDLVITMGAGNIYKEMTRA